MLNPSPEFSSVLRVWQNKESKISSTVVALQTEKNRTKRRWRVCDLVSFEPPFAVVLGLLLLPKEDSLLLLITTMLVCDLFSFSFSFLFFFFTNFQFLYSIWISLILFICWLLILGCFFPVVWYVRVLLFSLSLR